MSSPDGICPRCATPAGAARFCSECGLQLRPDFYRSPGPELLRPVAGELVAGPKSQARRRARRRAAKPEPDVVWTVGLLPPGGAGERSGSHRQAGPPVALVPKRVRQDWRVGRRELAARMLELARSEASLEQARLPGELGALFLRRYDARRTTQEAYARDLADWLAWLAMAGIDPYEATLASVESYTREPLADGHAPAPATVARRLACLSGFYRRCQYAGQVQRNPVAEANRPKVPELTATLGLSQARAQQLIRVARAVGARETLLVLLMLELGLRVSEVVGADIEDVGDEGRFRVLQVRGKGQSTKATRVPLNPALVESIRQATVGRVSGPLLVTGTGRRLTRQHAGKIIRALGEELGVKGLHPHALRHAFVTLSLDAGETLRDVQDAARHADPRTTRRYDNNRNSLERHPTHKLLGLLEPLRAAAPWER